MNKIKIWQTDHKTPEQ